MNKKKQVLFTMAGILLICVLFSTAMIFPKYFSLYNDSKILNITKYIDINNDMYEVSYTSFTDKLKAIARCNSSGIEIRSVKINDTGFRVDNKSINKIVKKEFNSLRRIGGLPKKIKLNANKISSCETYTLYTTNTTDSMKGIVYRKIIYEMKQGDIIIYFDEEYHKIYEMIIPLSLYFPASKIITDKSQKSYSYPQSVSLTYDRQAQGIPISTPPQHLKSIKTGAAVDSIAATNYLKQLSDTVYCFLAYYSITGNIITNEVYQLPPSSAVGIIAFDDASILEIKSELISLSDHLSIKLGINWGER